MALALGLENKRNVVLVVVLFAGILGYFGYQAYNSFSTPSPAVSTALAAPASTSPAISAASSKASAADGSAEKLTNAGIDPALHFDKLVASEDVRYEGAGRNIFSAESAPVAIPAPLKGPRNTPSSSPGAPIAAASIAPKAPPIDLKYFGYEQQKDKTYRAFFAHGDDIYIARTGEIVDHRYKVGAIQPLNVEITDLSYNNTQMLPIAAN